MNTQRDETDSPLLRRGTRRVHKNSGQVWRVVDVIGEPGENGCIVVIVAEDEPSRIRRVWRVYWLSDAWDRPKSRAGCRS